MAVGRLWRFSPAECRVGILALVTPAFVGVEWRTRSEQPAFERFATAAAVTLPVALALGLVLLVSTTTNI